MFSCRLKPIFPVVILSVNIIGNVYSFNFIADAGPSRPIIFPGELPNVPIDEPSFPVFEGRPSTSGRSNDLDGVILGSKYGADDTRCSGVCLHPRECSRLGGLANKQCMNGGGRVCCHFQQSCSDETSERKASFKSPGYPGPTVGNIVCQYDIHIQAGVCGVRLEFTDFNTTRPLDRGICNIDQFIIMNSLDGAAFPRCGELTGYSTLVPVNPRHRIPLTLLSIIQSSREQYKWNITISQVKCDEVKLLRDAPNCGKKFVEAENDTTVTTTLPPELENALYATDGYMEISRAAVDTAFYIDYLKQAHQVLSNSSSNITHCRNREVDIKKEKLQEQRMANFDYDDDYFDMEDKGRILRGTDAQLNQFPWQVSIQDAKGHVCGGAIISNETIVTASHCFLSVAPVPVRTIKIIVGDLNINSTTETQHQRVNLSSITFHSHFDPYYLENDIAVIKLSTPLKFRSGVQPVCLPERGNSYAAKKALVSGWGAVSYPQGKLATNLQFVNNTVVENSECKKTLKIDYITNTMICAVSYPNCSGTCFGDSGGPLVVENEKTQATSLVGIVSFGIGGCALFPNWPDVYTRVTEYIDWLSYAVTFI